MKSVYPELRDDAINFSRVGIGFGPTRIFLTYFPAPLLEKVGWFPGWRRHFHFVLDKEPL